MMSSALLQSLSLLPFVVSLKNLLPMESNVEPVEGIVNSLIMRLLKRMYYASTGNGTYLGSFFLLLLLPSTFFVTMTL